MYQLIYLEVNLICIFLLAIILFKMRKNIDKQINNVTFFRVVVATIIILALDVLWMLIEGRQGVGFREANLVLNALYLADTGIISYLWFVYVEYKLNQYDKLSVRSRYAIAIPVAILSLLCIFSIWTEWLFYVDANNIYHRGELHFLQPLIAYGYLAVVTVQILYYLCRKKYRHRRKQLLLLLSFVILPAIGGWFNSCFYGLPSIWPAATLSLLMIFINFQDYQISTDGLTKLNNRRQFDKYLFSITEDTRKLNHFVLYLMDIDFFKQINDTYGHLAGDSALIQTAQVLQSVCKSRNAFLARYGGDEFAVIYHYKQKEEARTFIEEVNAGLESFNLSGIAPYELKLSIGYCFFDAEEPMAAAELIIKADQALYRQKMVRKQKK
ncbi:MAG: GGDEF domain-containing protein [Christensenella sp.]|nr:GGDEF domain-containing protein [Christensenella sp.]